MTDVSARSARVTLATLVLCILVAASCGRLFAKRISTILGELGKYQGKTVTVYGTVKERIDLSSLKCYIVNDGGGAIGVVTKGPLPLVGQKVIATGRVERSFAIGARKLVVIIEPPRPTPTRPRNPRFPKLGPS